MEETETQLEIYEEESPSYCIELKEMWSQFDDQIKWITNDYSDGWVRLGDINITRINFWKEDPHWNFDKIDRDPPLTDEEMEWSKLVKTHYSGYYIHIINLRTGEGLNRRFKIDFGRDAYLHKKNWTWNNDHEVDIGDLIKKAARAWMFIEVWCL